MGRTFEIKKATRERVPLLLGLVGPSGSGKTVSALRLATGIQRVNGGRIRVIDTEAKRATHYANDFDFDHVDFAAPFSPADYQAVIEQCARDGGVVIVDSMSHEHEGPGGVLEMHETEMDRLAKLWGTKRSNTQMAAWDKPKRERRRMINTVLQLPCSFIFCFRAKPKLKIEKGKDPRPLGWMAIGAEELLYEMSLNAIMLPGACGVPTWQSDDEGTKQQMKRAGWAHGIVPDGRQFDEDMGAALARWAAGDVQRDVPALLAAYAACTTPATLGTLEVDRRQIWKSATADQKKALKEAADAATARVRAAEERQTDPSSGELSPEEEAAIAAAS